nr:PREDICTED: calcitonin gene-related peptide type 1 receptor isoform X2 [Latimeria chalumnae]|eukprot:XP_014340300.1 PREDICTED: calcitonin gene-related peptide type 1 receptor isoform X2 [Latimeria chalumnae]
MSQQQIMSAQFECYLKILGDPPYQEEEPYCQRTWDGWLCWEDTLPGTVVTKFCPEYFQDFDPSEKVTKVCEKNGKWFQHPDSNRTWTNYTLCTKNIKEKLKTAYILYYLAISGHGLSIVSLLISLGIFSYFKSLSCQRITLHKNLFLSFLLNSIVTIIWFSAVANNQMLVARNPIGCKVLQFLCLYLMGSNYFWMLCEGIYLHTLIIVAVFVEEQQLSWYYILGWGFPVIPGIIHAVARFVFYNDNCWISAATHLLYIIHGPICAALLVNLFFLLNIVRVLITKLKVTHKAESSTYMKAVRATLILIPLLGIQFVLVPWKPMGHVAAEVYEYAMHILMHYQGLLVATIFCFFNGEVQAVLKRQWRRYRVQCGNQVVSSETSHSNNHTTSSELSRPTHHYTNGSTNGKSEKHQPLKPEETRIL